jgi:hypothetical protein
MAGADPGLAAAARPAHPARRRGHRDLGGAVALWVVSGAHFFWPAFPLFFLALGLARHARWQGGGWYGRWGPPLGPSLDRGSYR